MLSCRVRVYWMVELEARLRMRSHPGSYQHLFCLYDLKRHYIVLPRLIRCELFRLRCHGHNLLLSSYLCRIKGRRILHATPADTLYRI